MWRSNTEILMTEQISFDYLPCMNSDKIDWYCNCICRDCLYWWSSRCPYGDCYDDLRAVEYPYDALHPGKIRNGWSGWNKPGEQAHWCRDGVCYPATHCLHYVKYIECTVKECLKATVQVFQDGYIDCSLIENYGCEKCMEEWERKQEENT